MSSIKKYGRELVIVVGALVIMVLRCIGLPEPWPDTLAKLGFLWVILAIANIVYIEKNKERTNL